MGELPWMCSGCGKWNMIDLLKLERRAVDKIFFVDGFLCDHCKMWVNVFYTTRSLQDAMKKLESMDEKRKDFRYHFAKVMRKAEGVQERMNE